eukprot:4731581-Amphidinium_carterae.3
MHRLKLRRSGVRKTLTQKGKRNCTELRDGLVLRGTGNNQKLRDLKKKLAEEGLTDPVKIAENEYWVKRYGHKRWGAKYMDHCVKHQASNVQAL